MTNYDPNQNSNKKIKLKYRLLPAIVLITYLNITVFLFAYGPWKWPIRDGLKLYTFLALAHIVLFIGYFWGVKKIPKTTGNNIRIEKLVSISLLFNLAILIPTIVGRTGNLFPNIVDGIIDPGASYGRVRNIRTSTLSVYTEYIRIVLAPLLSLLFPLTIFYWQKLNKKLRWLSFFVIITYISIFISMGTNKGLFDFILLTPWLLLASYLSGNFKINFTKKLLITLFFIGFMIFGFMFFTSGQRTRAGSGAEAGYFSKIDIHADFDNKLIAPLPDNIKIGAISLTSYLTQGYYALYLSLNRPFIPMYGIGNSFFLFRNFSRLTGYDQVEKLPYPVRIEKYGWDAYGKWSTIYPWIASDVSFPGTILVVCLIGYFWGLAWVDSLKGNNPFAVVALSQFLTMVYYFPGNNQVLQSGESLVGFTTIFFIWIFTRNRKRKQIIGTQVRFKNTNEVDIEK